MQTPWPTGLIAASTDVEWCTVLLICNDADQRALARATLDRDGYRTLAAASAAEAMRLLSHDTPDIIVADAELPDADAEALMHRLRLNLYAAEVAILLVQRAEDWGRAEVALSAGADQVAAYPLTPYELRTRVQSLRGVLRARRTAQQTSDHRAELAQALLVFVDTCAAVDSAAGLDTVFEHAVSATTGLTASVQAAILLKPRAVEELVVAATIGERFGQRGAHIAACNQTAFQVARTGVLMLADERDQAHAGGTADAQAAYVPLVVAASGGQPDCLGVLYARASSSTPRFSERDLRFLELLSMRTASAIQHVMSRSWADQTRDTLVRALVMLTERRDDDTGRHIDRVTTYARLLAEKLRERRDLGAVINDNFIQNLLRTTALHDIGKVGIPDTILFKPGPLEAVERSVMQTHTIIGADTLRAAQADLPESDMLQMAEDIARYHHERVDGTGYPERLRGDQIPLAARIVALADVYDALRSARPYKDSLEHAAAVDIIVAGRDRQFDSRIVDAFLAQQDRFAQCAEELRDTSDSQPRGRLMSGLRFELPWWLGTAAVPPARDPSPSAANRSDQLVPPALAALASAAELGPGLFLNN